MSGVVSGAGIRPGSQVAVPAIEFACRALQLCAELIEARCVAVWECTDNDIHGRNVGQDCDSKYLTQASLEAISRYRGIAVSGYDDAGAWERWMGVLGFRGCRRGSECPEFQFPGPDSLPLSPDPFEVLRCGQPLKPRVAEESLADRRRNCRIRPPLRTWWGCEP